MLEFLIIVRDVLNKHGLGLLDKLASNDKYKSLQNKLSKKIEIFNDDPPDWYIYCLILPSSINYFYLYWNYLPNSERAHIPIKMFNVSEFKKIRNTGNTEMMKDINNMINEEFR
jgi:DNA topoisomerase VI subunit A